MSLNCLVSAQVGMRPSPGHLLQKNNTSQPAEPAQVAVSIDSSSFPTPSMLFITGHAVTKFPLLYPLDSFRPLCNSHFSSFLCLPSVSTPLHWLTVLFLPRPTLHSGPSFCLVIQYPSHIGEPEPQSWGGLMSLVSCSIWIQNSWFQM